MRIKRESLKKLFDIITPRFKTESVALQIDHKGQLNVLCCAADLRPHDYYHALGAATHFNFFGLALAATITNIWYKINLPTLEQDLADHDAVWVYTDSGKIIFATSLNQIKAFGQYWMPADLHRPQTPQP